MALISSRASPINLCNSAKELQESAVARRLGKMEDKVFAAFHARYAMLGGAAVHEDTTAFHIPSTPALTAVSRGMPHTKAQPLQEPPRAHPKHLVLD